MSTHKDKATNNPVSNIGKYDKRISTISLSNQTQYKEKMSGFLKYNSNRTESKPLFCAMEILPYTQKEANFDGRARLPAIEKKIFSDSTLIHHEDIPEIWDVKILPQIPSGYPLAKTCFEVGLINGAPVVDLANRAYMLNKERSIQADYFNEEAIAKCRTRSFMQFDIRLFQSTTRDNVLVEVRRMDGCSLDFREEYLHIVQTLNNLNSVPRRVPLCLNINLSPKECFSHNFIPLPETEIKERLKFCLHEISSDIHDVRILSLENLVTITDPCLSQIAPTACTLILRNYQEILKLTLDIVQSTKYEYSVTEDDNCFERLRCMALTLLVNMCAMSSENETFISMTQSAKFLVNYLVGDIKMAGKYPWNACLAAKCLSILMANPNSIILNVDEDARNALENARLIGKKAYCSLEKEAIAAIDAIAASGYQGARRCCIASNVR